MSKDYLDKYRDKGEVKKKIKVKKFVGAGLKIVDADEGLTSYSAAAPSFKKKKDSKRRKVEDEDDDMNDPLLDPDELPTVVNMVDDRPVNIQLLEEFRQTNKWKVITADEKAKSNKADEKKVKSSKRTVDSDSDPSSPPRRGIRRGSDSDYSPPRQKRKEMSGNNGGGKRGGGSDSDFSPPRKSGKQRGGRDSDESPPRRKRRDSDSDMSPPRKTVGSDSDASPPRRQQRPEQSSSRKSDKYGSSSRNQSSTSHSDKRRQQNKSDSDASPPRRGQRDSSRRNNKGSDSDHSPVRRGRNDSSPSRSSQKMTQTLDGKKAGLQTAGALKAELVNFKELEKERFSKMDDMVSGRYAKTKFRDRETGKLRDMAAESAQKAEEEKKLAERKDKYNKWGKGLKQAEEQEERVQSAIHEMAKPLARYKDDDDLDVHLRSLERDGDPMLKFLAKKKAKASGGPSKPVYVGPAPAPNRFRILPGYRWDGVDRSNGYEKEWFQKINSKKAFQDESYKWSVEDL